MARWAGIFFKSSMVKMPWSLKALAKFKHAGTLPTPSALSDCDRARTPESMLSDMGGGDAGAGVVLYRD